MMSNIHKCPLSCNFVLGNEQKPFMRKEQQNAVRSRQPQVLSV